MTLLTVTRHLPRGRGLAAALVRRAAGVELPWETRCRSRFEATDTAGQALGVFLPRGTVVRGGDVLVVDDGSLRRVVAAAEAVLVVRARAGGTPLDLLRAAYHLGNRHVQVEVAGDHLKLAPDHVLADLLRRMGLDVAEGSAPFEPEAGAYAAPGGDAQAHGHAHAHDHGHDHPPGHDHGHDHRHRD